MVWFITLNKTVPREQVSLYVGLEKRILRATIVCSIRARLHVSGYFLTRNFFPDSKLSHTN